ncbi:hypothetical protein IWX90DRAFT_126091 [Phyllosticta citrichinensis]|uniref:Uncharacterized protein n=1 Tax=Phyllosticta citrichinensis TaxID=1130410 RepID=A0ABR1Y420_9PEZI
MPKAPKEPKESKDSKERHAPHDIATRVHALALKVNGFTDKDILDQTGVASRTIRHIYSRARKRGFDPDKSKRIELRFIEDGKRTGRPRKDANVGKPGDLQPHVDANASDGDGPSQLSPVDGSSNHHHPQHQLQQPSHPPPPPPPQPQSVDDHPHQHQHLHPHQHPHQHQHQHQHPNPQADQHSLMEPALQQPLQPLAPHHHHQPKYLDTDPTAHHLDHHPWDAPPQHPATMHSMDLEAQLRDGLRASLNPQHPVIQMSEAAVDPSLRGHDMPVYQPPNAP